MGFVMDEFCFEADESSMSPGLLVPLAAKRLVALRFQMLEIRRAEDGCHDASRSFVERILEGTGHRGDGAVPFIQLPDEFVLIPVIPEAAAVTDVHLNPGAAKGVENGDDAEVAFEEMPATDAVGILGLAPGVMMPAFAPTGGNPTIACHDGARKVAETEEGGFASFAGPSAEDPPVFGFGPQAVKTVGGVLNRKGFRAFLQIRGDGIHFGKAHADGGLMGELDGTKHAVPMPVGRRMQVVNDFEAHGFREAKERFAHFKRAGRLLSCFGRDRTD